MDKTQLIHRVLSGKASEEEKREFDDWIARDSNNREEFEDLKLLWEYSDNPEPRDKDFYRGLEKIESTIESIKSKNRRIERLRIYSIAISIVLLGIIVIYFVYKPGDEIKVISGIRDQDAGNTMLPDSSVVALNKNSTFQFYDLSDTRKLVLAGEAFIKIAKDSLRPFHLEFNGVSLTAISATLIVKAYAREEIKIFMIEGGGVIMFSGKTQELKSGESVLLSPSGDSSPKTIQRDPNFDSWYSGVLRFDNSTLDDFSKTLKTELEFEIEVSDKMILNCRFTGTFYRSSAGVDIIRTVAESNGLNYEVLNSKKFLLRGKGCRD